MKVNSERLAELASELKRDINIGCCRSSVSVGKLGSVIFELVAYSRSEATDQGVDGPTDGNECLT